MSEAMVNSALSARPLPIGRVTSAWPLLSVVTVRVSPSRAIVMRSPAIAPKVTASQSLTCTATVEPLSEPGTR